MNRVMVEETGRSFMASTAPMRSLPQDIPPDQIAHPATADAHPPAHTSCKSPADAPSSAPPEFPQTHPWLKAAAPSAIRLDTLSPKQSAALSPSHHGHSRH